jgi:hypothetical protein
VLQAGRDLGVAPLGCVLVDHRGTRRRVAGTPHDLGQRDPALRGQGQSRVPQVVEVRAGQFGSPPDRGAGGVEVMGAERPAVTSDEQPSGR